MRVIEAHSSISRARHKALARSTSGVYTCGARSGDPSMTTILSRTLACLLSFCLACPAGAITPSAGDQVQRAASDPCATYDASQHCVAASGPVVPGGSAAAQRQNLVLKKTPPTKLDQGGPPTSEDSAKAKTEKPSLLSRLKYPLIGAGLAAGFGLVGFLAGGPAAGLACLALGGLVMAGMSLMNCAGGGAGGKK
jgi:hypothetical protein